jgi:hypothetical protein
MKNITKLAFICCLPFYSITINAQTLLGVYDGNQGWAMDEVVALENWQTKKHAVVTLFTGWSEKSESLLYDHQLKKIWMHGSIPLISWEPHIAAGTPDDIEIQIAQGDYDDYITSWANNLKTFVSGLDNIYGNQDDRRAYIRLAHEANGNWYPWSANDTNTPDDYIAMWQRVWIIFDQIGLDKSHIQWIWTVNASDHGDFIAEDYYPGDEFVDWIGIDGYNFGKDYSWSDWRSPEMVFEPMRQRMQTLSPNKPIAIPEVASSSNIGVTDTSSKDVWIADFFNYIETADIGLVSWFNEDKEADWKFYAGRLGHEVIEGVNTYPAYKTAIIDSNLMAADNNNVRLLTDEQFQGNFSSNSSNSINQAPEKSCEIHYVVSETWQGGYVAKVKVSANYMIANDWQVNWNFAKDGLVSKFWNANLSQNNNTVEATPPSWWIWVQPGTAPAFGFVGNGLPDYPISAELGDTQCDIKIYE